MPAIDLKKEQKASLERERLKYSPIAKFFFFGMDMLTGKKTTVAKAKLIETLASIPYRAWENRAYIILTQSYKHSKIVKSSMNLVDWGRDAQDNEYWHLLVLDEKMKEDGAKDNWYLNPVMVYLIVLTYVILTKTVAAISLKAAFLFNAQFEDHAEHVYAQFMDDNPGLDDQKTDSPVVAQYAATYPEDPGLKTWGDVVRRIGLDERDHMNHSFVFAGQPENVVKYDGMPENYE
ncbi:hypothetical protein BVX94_01165 [bacterium B17]|nr:hypothetical protein BVX94_01165 [bacterium B17]